MKILVPLQHSLTSCEHFFSVNSKVNKSYVKIYELFAWNTYMKNTYMRLNYALMS